MNQINFFQSFTSANTCVKQIPALFKKYGHLFGPKNIDVGGGKYDLGSNFLKSKFGIDSCVYDPFNRTKEFNDNTLKDFFGIFDSATIANVLNVIKEQEVRIELINFVKNAIKKQRKAYFAIYEGSRNGTGCVTKKGYQNNKKAAEYGKEIASVFSNIKRSGHFIIAY